MSIHTHFEFDGELPNDLLYVECDNCGEETEKVWNIDELCDDLEKSGWVFDYVILYPPETFGNKFNGVLRSYCMTEDYCPKCAKLFKLRSE